MIPGLGLSLGFSKTEAQNAGGPGEFTGGNASVQVNRGDSRSSSFNPFTGRSEPPAQASMLPLALLALAAIAAVYVLKK
jgi:hypothetical protein